MNASADEPQKQPPQADAKKHDEPAARRKGLQSGFSLLARGEPQIWFTGGMLAVCLMMIVGLLALILYVGLPAFWPRPVQWLVLNDGSFDIGQPERTQIRESSDPADSTGVVGEASGPPAREADQRLLLSRYFRTGNWEITGNHYRWFSPQELQPSGILQPRWAMVVERLEYGRLYGLLGQLTVAIDVGQPANQSLADLERLKQLVASFESTESAAQPALLEAVEETQKKTLSQALRQASQLAISREQLEVRTEQAADQWQSLTAAPADAVLLDARRRISDSPQVLVELQSILAQSRRLRQRAEDLKYRISRMDAELSELRATIRRAEISTKTPAVQEVEGSHYMLERLEELARQQIQLQQNRPLIQEIVQQAGLGTAASDLIDSFERTTLPARVAEVTQQLDDWLEPVRTQPEALLAAVLDYQAGYRRVVGQKQPLEQELREVEQQLHRGEVVFLVPFGSAPVEMSDSETRQLLELRPQDWAASPTRDQALGVLNPTADLFELEKLGERLALATYLDQSGNKQVLAISTATESPPDPTERTYQTVLLAPKAVAIQDIVRAIPANQLQTAGRLAVYADRWREFLLENPREANTEGGVFPAIWGTVVMTLIMTIAVVPFGVMAALYLREYTKSGPLVSVIRISINNLAGVPSIVYGVFGFSFFCYTIGAYIDGGPKNAGITPWPSPLWFAMLAITAIVGTAAFFFSFFGSGPSHSQTRFKRWASRAAMFLWLAVVAVMAILILRSPFFEGFYREYLPNPTFGKGGLLWASLTLSLLTLPVVIVATEEALAAVPNSLREGSLACGASKWQTIRRIVLPHARPGILTGAILAMARGAGEVAPLMLVGALPSAPDLPLDSEFPFFHGSRSFMHLGYQIYTLGFQSQNSEAAKPMVFTCALLLILIVAALNLSAIYLRGRLKRQFHGNQF